jgi:hypothetical protein
MPHLLIVTLQQLPKVFSVMAHAQKPKSPLPPLCQRGGTARICFKSPPLKKGDLGGFKNQQVE